jgi:hypothetical protein
MSLGDDEGVALRDGEPIRKGGCELVLQQDATFL